MVQIVPARKVNLGMLETQFGLTVAQNLLAFPEWQVEAELEPDTCAALARVKRNYEYLLKDPPILEETVKLVVLSPLLDLAGFYQSPFRIRTEVPVGVTSQDEDGIQISGAIDALVVLEMLWVVVIEAKMSDFSLQKALPQTLSYMLASTQPVNYGLVTNGNEFLFIKLTRSAQLQYSTSRVFSLFAPGNELESVVKVLRHLGQQITTARP
jgi:predicted type IV restriction endonuclease